MPDIRVAVEGRRIRSNPDTRIRVNWQIGACTESRFSRCESLDWLVAEHSGQSRVCLETLQSCV